MKHENPILYQRLREHLAAAVRDEIAREQRRVHAHLALFAVCAAEDATIATVLDAVGNEMRAERAIRDLVAARAVHRDGDRLLPAFTPAELPDDVSAVDLHRHRSQALQLQRVREDAMLDREPLAAMIGLTPAELEALEDATVVLDPGEWRRLAAIYAIATTAELERRRAWLEQIQHVER